MPTGIPGSVAYNVSQHTPTGGLMSGIGIGGPGVYQYTPPREHLVEGRMNGLMNQNKPYLTQARDSAMETSLARGQDGSYAAGASQRAAIDAALPIASQDSETLTRIGMANASANQDYSSLLAQLEGARMSTAGQTVYGGDSREQMDHQLQMQREHDAYLGEQNAYGRQQENSMAQFGLMGDLYTGQQNFGNTRQLGFDDYGFNSALSNQNFNQGRTMANDQFGYNTSLAGDQFGYQSALQRNASDLGLRQSYFNYGADLSQNMQSFYQNIILGGMQNPEFMADPEGFFGFAQYATGQVPGAGSSFFSNLFGGNRQGRQPYGG